MTTTQPHAYTPSAEDAALCADCGEGPNTDAHADGAVPLNGASEPKRGRGRPRKAVESEERAQMALEEKELDDPALEAALGMWMDARAGIEDAREAFKNKDDRLGAMVGDREMIEGTYRFGRYVMTVSDVAAHQRIKVKLAKNL